MRWLPKRPSPITTGDIGRRAETLVRRYLEARGLRTIARNFRSAWGEIDLVMDDGDCLVFVEVRYRRGSGWGSPAETVDRRKQAKIIRCALHYVDRHSSLADRPLRFDIVSVTAGKGEDPALDWIRNAFEPRE